MFDEENNDDSDKTKKVSRKKTTVKKLNTEYVLENFNWKQNLKVLKKGFFFCISDTKSDSFVRICSDSFKLKNKKLINSKPRIKTKPIFKK